MSIEIRELIIKTLIEEGLKKGSNVEQPAPADDCSLLSIREQIVEECIEKTLEIIERRSSR